MSNECLKYLGIYEKCKFCDGSLVYKQCGFTFRYKSTCKVCKEKRQLYFKKQYYKKMGWEYKTEEQKRLETEKRLRENEGRTILNW